jgi:hypothetical protein
MAERTAGLTNPDDAPAVPEHPVSLRAAEPLRVPQVLLLAPPV